MNFEDQVLIYRLIKEIYRFKSIQHREKYVVRFPVSQTASVFPNMCETAVNWEVVNLKY